MIGITVDGDEPHHLTSNIMKIAGMAFKGVAGSVGSFQPVAGIGDEAYVGPMGSTLMFRESDVMVNMDLRVVGNNVDAAKVITRKIVSRLQ